MLDEIEKSAVIADQAVAELDAILKGPKARKTQYDRQTVLEIRYAIRWCKRIADRIRAQRPAPDDDVDTLAVDPRFQDAQAVLRDLRPLVAKAGSSNWRTMMMQRIDGLLK